MVLKCVAALAVVLCACGPAAEFEDGAAEYELKSACPGDGDGKDPGARPCLVLDKEVTDAGVSNGPKKEAK